MPLFSSKKTSQNWSFFWIMLLIKILMPYDFNANDLLSFFATKITQLLQLSSWIKCVAFIGQGSEPESVNNFQTIWRTKAIKANYWESTFWKYFANLWRQKVRVIEKMERWIQPIILSNWSTLSCGDSSLFCLFRCIFFWQKFLAFPHLLSSATLHSLNSNFK